MYKCFKLQIVRWLIDEVFIWLDLLHSVIMI